MKEDERRLIISIVFDFFDGFCAVRKSVFTIVIQDSQQQQPQQQGVRSVEGVALRVGDVGVRGWGAGEFGVLGEKFYDVKAGKCLDFVRSVLCCCCPMDDCETCCHVVTLDPVGVDCSGFFSRMSGQT